MSACSSELWFNKIFLKSGFVHLIDVARRFKLVTAMQDMVCSLHLATLTQSCAAQAHCVHVGRKSANNSPQAVKTNPGISGEVAAWWL